MGPFRELHDMMDGHWCGGENLLVEEEQADDV
jgi:hypothetical protein